MFETKYYIEADQLTLRRFREIEVFIMLEDLSAMVGYEEAVSFLKKALQITYEESDRFRQFLSRPNKPTKKEIIIYYRYYETPYDKIRVMYGISPITIKKYIDQYNSKEFKMMPKSPTIQLEMVPFIKKALKNMYGMLADDKK